MRQHLAAAVPRRLVLPLTMSGDTSFVVLIDALAAALGVRPPSGPASIPGNEPSDLSEPRALVGRDEAWLLEGLRQGVGGGEPLTRARRALGALVAADVPVTLFADEGAACAHLLGTGGALAVGDALAEQAGAARCAPAEVSASRLRGVSVLVVEPTFGTEELSRVLGHAAAAGVPVVFDERRTAGRAAMTTVASSFVHPQPGGLRVLLGASLAAGLPFAAIVGEAGVDAGHPVTACVVAIVAERLAAAPLQPELARRAAEIVAATDAAAAQHEVRIAWSGPAAMPRLTFADQEGAQGELILHHFGLELAAVGCRSSGPLLLPAAVRCDGARAAASAFAHAIARVRTLLIEYNSYLSGGIPYVFPGGDPVLRERGVTRYRYPRLAAVDVDAHGAAIRIAFAAGDLGPVTSSGFYAPTRLVGDVDVAVRYVVRQFSSGPDATCLGLFLQNEASTARYYAQLMSTADAPTARSVALGFGGAVFGRRPVASDTGWLRLVRRGGTVTALHRDGDEASWREVASVAATADDLVVGAKIWSKVRTEGLVADLFDLAVEAQLAPDQAPLLESRPDPRFEARSR